MKVPLRRLVDLILLLGMTTAPLLAQEPKFKYEPKKFITQQQVERSGRFKIEIKGLGNFEIQDLMLKGDRRSRCAVEIRSLEQVLRRKISRQKIDLSPGMNLKVSFDKTGCTGPDGEILLCCMDEGSACEVNLVVQQVY